MGWLGYLLAGFIGFMFGVVITCILLAKKNLEAYQAISKKTENNLKTNIELAKGAYKAYLNDLDGEEEESDVTDETEDSAGQEEE